MHTEKNHKNKQVKANIN